MVRQMSAKEANIQVKSLIDFQKAWRTADQDLFKKLKESLSPSKILRSEICLCVYTPKK